MSNEIIKQFGIEHYFNTEEEYKMKNIETKNNTGLENDKYVDNKKIDNLNGFIEVKYGNETYKSWKVEFIRSFIYKFIKEKYPDSLIIHELNKIDLVIIDKKTENQIPVEIQKSTIAKSGNNYIFKHSPFEQLIRKQIEDNIENYELCWFFFDSEYHRYLQSDSIRKYISIDLTWLVKLMKEVKLKVFTIKYDGFVKELTTKDFDFLKNISQTCVIGYDNDERVLNRNKLKIYSNEAFGYKFTQKEIDTFYTEISNTNHENDKGLSCAKFFEKYGNDRCKLYGKLLHSIGNLNRINKMLDMDGNNLSAKEDSVCLGIFKVNGTFGKGNLVEFVDKFGICKYFPGYLRNKEQWESYRGTNLDHNTFVQIVTGALKFSKIIGDY